MDKTIFVYIYSVNLVLSVHGLVQNDTSIYEFSLKNDLNQPYFNKWVSLRNSSLTGETFLKIEQKELFLKNGKFEYKSTPNFVTLTGFEFYEIFKFLCLSHRNIINIENSQDHSIAIRRSVDPYYIIIFKDIFNNYSDLYDNKLRGIKLDKRESFQLLSNSSSILNDLGY